MPRSSDALSSKMRCLYSSGPNSSRATARMVVVFPVPGGPWNSKCGKFPCKMLVFNVFTTSS